MDEVRKSRDDEDAIRERWPTIRQSLKTTWGRLTEADLRRENGDRDYVIDKVAEHYGYDRERAERLVRDFERSL